MSGPIKGAKFTGVYYDDLIEDSLAQMKAMGIEDLHAPTILCTGCGRRLQRLGDYYRCQCGREVRP